MSVPSTSSVTLVIKAPNQKIADQRIECTTDWTVRKLKQHLSKVYPTNPAESQQRIIYAGKLLQDDHQLENVLKQYAPDQNVHTVHLVCMASMSDSQVPGSTPVPDVAEGVLLSEGLRRRLPAEAQSSYASPELNTSSRSAFPSMDYQSYVHQTGMMYYGAVPPMVQPFVPGFMPYGAEQLQWMQQAYAQSMMNYMQQFQQATVQPHLAGHAQPVAPVIPVPLANQNFPNELPGAAIAEPEPPLQQMRINAQGAREDDDEAAERGNRDWLDSTYVFVRFMMLMSILYFYSTPHRFLATLALALIVYVGRAGWLRRGRRENRNAEERAAPPPPPPQQTPQQADAVQNAQPSEDAEQETNMVDLQATHRLSTFEVIWSVITSFFTSLIPENRPPININ